MQHYEISDDIQVVVKIEKNPYHIPPERLFAMAARKNKKRRFLFVSKVLGKHIPVPPATAFLNTMALAARYYEETFKIQLPQTKEIILALKNGKNADQTYDSLKEHLFLLPRPTLFIGFAETATALGHAVFECFSDNGFFIHTTRENIAELDSRIAFEEEHCHATSHRVYAPGFSVLESDCPVVLIDDEITTGKTALNIIGAIHHIYPRKNYSVLSILDWRTHENKALFDEKETQLGVKIQAVSLLSGSFELNQHSVKSYYEMPDSSNFSENVPADNPATNRGPQPDYLYLDLFFPERLRYSSQDGERLLNRTPYIKNTGRFGISSEENRQMNESLKNAGQHLRKMRRGKKILCMGTGEFMYIPMKIASCMGKDVLFQSTSRSPIYPNDREGYGVKNAFVFESPDDPAITNYFYNIPFGCYDEIYLFLEREIEKQRLNPLIEQIEKTGAERLCIVVCSGNKAALSEPDPLSPPLAKGAGGNPPRPPFAKGRRDLGIGVLGSYSSEDVIFLLKDVSDLIKEQGNDERERAIQSGVHYSEMLPIEYRPTEEYMKIFYDSLKKYDKKIAIASGLAAERILKHRGKNIVFVSLARAGTPAGILMKRYLKAKYHINLPHYSISIIRGKGIDENAIWYILKKHPGAEIQFIDGWTGKGSITKELHQACDAFRKKWNIPLNSDMAVIADPGYCVRLFGTREDFMIPSACLNATVSGLVSRTVHRSDLIGENEFHGVKFYKELLQEDVSNLFTDMVSDHYPAVFKEVETRLGHSSEIPAHASWRGMKDVRRIQNDFGIRNVHLVKPGIGETTRVLLRRIPWKVLVTPNAKNLDHILQLAKEKQIPVEEYRLSAYHCCGVIKPLN